jgi:hypothetical protein
MAAELRHNDAVTALVNEVALSSVAVSPLIGLLAVELYEGIYNSQLLKVLAVLALLLIAPNKLA